MRRVGASARRLLRWLAFLGSPAGRRDLPDIVGLRRYPVGLCKLEAVCQPRVFLGLSHQQGFQARRRGVRREPPQPFRLVRVVGTNFTLPIVNTCSNIMQARAFRSRTRSTFVTECRPSMNDGADYGVLCSFSGTRFFGSSSRIWNARLAISTLAMVRQRETETCARISLKS